MGELSLELTLVLVAALLLLGVLASKASAKLGVPALIFFIVIGMLAGSEGPGGIHFEDVGLTRVVGWIALAFILFAGGLDTTWETVKPIFWRGLSLATVGIVVTAGLVGLFAHQFLGFSLLEALLLGAVVSSTDAAAVFGVLRVGNLKLKQRITPLLEFESGINDPLAIFLTLSLAELLVAPGASPWDLVPNLLMEMPIGAAVGFFGAVCAVWLINRIRLEYDGLYPVITLAFVCLIFGGAHLVHGNAFLAVYMAGLTMGSRNFLHKIALVQFHEGMAWLMQISMFAILGLLVFPSQLLDVVVPGLILSTVLIFFVRPLAVLVSLAFANMSKRSKFFVAWAGLRGAVPIILATFPLMEGVPKASLIFNLVFFIVLTSVLIQGATLSSMARWTSMDVPPMPGATDMKPASHTSLLEIALSPGSPTIGKQVVELGLPSTALLVLLRRDGESYIPRGATTLQPHDVLTIATRREDREELKARFKGT